MAKNNKSTETKQVKTEETYNKEIEELEASKVDASSNYQKAEEFMLKVVKDEQISTEEKAKLLDKVYKQLLLTDEQKLMLNDVYIAEYSKTKQFKDEYIKNLMENMADDDDTIYQFRIKNNINRIYPAKEKTINTQFENYIKKHNFDNRKNKIFFCCDNKQVNNGFGYIFKYYGGEITYNVFNNNILGKELLLNIGTPYIIKFVYNFDDLDWFVLDNLKQQIRDKLLKNKNIAMDFSMEKDVEVKDIIGVYEVEKINNMYHIKRYVNNKNFRNR